MKLIIFFCLGGLLASCSATNLLRRAEVLIDRAEAKGAKWKTDSVFQTIEFTAPKLTFSTTLNDPNWTDTLYLRGKDSIQVKIKRIITPGKKETVYVQADCPEQKIQKKVATAINKKIEAGYSVWQMVILGIVAVIVGYFISIAVNSFRRNR